MKVKDIIQHRSTGWGDNKVRLLLARNRNQVALSYFSFIPPTAVEYDAPIWYVLIFKDKLRGKYVAIQNNMQIPLSDAVRSIRKSNCVKHIELTDEFKRQMLLEEI